MSKASGEKRIRVLIAKPGLDGHDRGAKVIARALRDAGMEVVYTGIRQTPEQIVNAAIQEDVDVVGVSCMCNEHMTFMPRVAGLLQEKTKRPAGGLPLLLAGGVIPEEDRDALRDMGVDAVFPAGSLVEEIVRYIRVEVAGRSQGVSVADEGREAER